MPSYCFRPCICEDGGTRTRNVSPTTLPCSLGISRLRASLRTVLSRPLGGVYPPCFAEQVTRLPFSLRLQVARLIWLRRALDVVVYGFRQRTASLGSPYFFLRRRLDSLNFSSTFSTSIIIHRPYWLMQSSRRPAAFIR